MQLSGCTNHNHTLDKEAGLFLMRHLLAYREGVIGKEQQQQHSLQGEVGTGTTTTGTVLEGVNHSSSSTELDYKLHPDPRDNEVPRHHIYLPVNMSILVSFQNMYVLS